MAAAALGWPRRPNLEPEGWAVDARGEEYDVLRLDEGGRDC